MSNCRSCGNFVSDHSQFCGHCGQSIDTAQISEGTRLGSSTTLPSQSRTTTHENSASPKNINMILVIIIALLTVTLAISLLKNGIPTPTQSNQSSQSTPTPLTAQQPPQYIHIGGLDLYAYCRFLGYVQVALDGNSPRDWRCVTQTGTHTSLNLTKACQWQYNRDDTIAVIQDDTTPGGAQCYVPST